MDETCRGNGQRRRKRILQNACFLTLILFGPPFENPVCHIPNDDNLIFLQTDSHQSAYNSF